MNTSAIKTWRPLGRNPKLVNPHSFRIFWKIPLTVLIPSGLIPRTLLQSIRRERWFAHFSASDADRMPKWHNLLPQPFLICPRCSGRQPLLVIFIMPPYTRHPSFISSTWAKSRGGRGGGGGGGCVPPPTILKVGDTISNVPPRFCGRTIFRRKNRICNKICWLFFFLLVRMSELDRRVPLICH